MAPYLRTRKSDTIKPTSPNAKSLAASDYAAIHKTVVASISKMGPNVTSQLTGKKTFPSSSKIAKKHQMSSAVSARIVRELTIDVPKKDINKRKAVAAQVRNRAVVNEIRKMVRNPMKLLTTNSVKTGVDVGFVTQSRRNTAPTALVIGRVGKKAATPRSKGVSPTTMRKKVTKTVASEIQKLGKGKLPAPSVIKARARIAPAKIAVNTEILKRAAVKEIRNKRKPISPLKSPKKSTASKSGGSLVKAKTH
ncbi:hypothetical protein MT418_001008 [Batrachochytrium dendrobatidis]